MMFRMSKNKNIGVHAFGPILLVLENSINGNFTRPGDEPGNKAATGETRKKARTIADLEHSDQR